MNRTNQFKIIQWTYDFIQNAQQDAGMPLGKKTRPNHFYLKPFSLDYYAPTNPVLLGGNITKKLINKKIWTLRDGLIPLSFFFRENSPSKMPGEFAIHKDLWFLVPEQWRDKIVFYDIKSDYVYNEEHLPENLFITGMLNSTFADLEEFENDLLAISNRLGKKNIEKMKIIAFFPNKRNNLWGKWSDENSLEFSKHLFSKLKMDIQFPGWETIQAEMNFKNYLYHEINRGYFIQDTYTKYFALSRGAGLLQENNFESPLKEIANHRLSLHHSLSIYLPDFSKLPRYSDPFKDDYFFYFQDLCKGHIKNVRTSPNWDSWFALYLKKFYKINPPTMKTI
ncbi:MAG: hypothetical protein PHY93_06005 [Bacteriovorax sp.]|nr:hypothetical protein [Bacteriovorax sp.]